MKKIAVVGLGIIGGSICAALTKAGYVVEDVIVDNVSVGAVTEYEFVNIRGDHTITAIFAEIAE